MSDTALYMIKNMNLLAFRKEGRYLESARTDMRCPQIYSEIIVTQKQTRKKTRKQEIYSKIHQEKQKP